MKNKDNIIKDLKIVYYALGIVSILVGYVYLVKDYYSSYNNHKEEF